MTASVAILDVVAAVENHPRTTRRGGITGRGFTPGQSGNPGGRPQGLARRARELVGDDGDAIASFLLAVMTDNRERTRDRLDAARLLGDRGWGRPIQAVDVEVAQPLPAFDPDQLVNLPPEELDLLIALAEKGFLSVGPASESGKVS